MSNSTIKDQSPYGRGPSRVPGRVAGQQLPSGAGGWRIAVPKGADPALKEGGAAAPVRTRRPGPARPGQAVLVAYEPGRVVPGQTPAPWTTVVCSSLPVSTSIST
jgi:hypothetical protein